MNLFNPTPDAAAAQASHAPLADRLVQCDYLHWNHSGETRLMAERQTVVSAVYKRSREQRSSRRRS